jgi:hypothetical protein
MDFTLPLIYSSVKLQKVGVRKKLGKSFGKSLTALGTFTGELYVLSKDKKSINNVIANYKFNEVIEAISLNLQTGKLLVGGRDGKLGLYQIES